MSTENPRPVEEDPLRDRPTPGLEPEPTPVGAEPSAAPPPILAPGSQDDSFLRSPHSQRLVPDLVDSSPELPAVPDPVAGPDSDALLGAIDTTPPPRPAAPPVPAEEWVEADDAGPGPSWPMVLLGSYASAVTLALIWVLIRDRGREPGVEAPSPAPIAFEAPPEASPGRTIAPLAPVSEDRTARFGSALRVGSLAITPLEAKRRDVLLRRTGLTGDVTERQGLPGTIILKLRLQNTSDDQIFAPLDPSFVRQRGTSTPECFAETSTKERIYPYPLALESEMGIVGQDFGELRPGESREVAIALSPKSPTIAPETLRWRIQLRTGVGQVEPIGIAPSAPPGR